MHCDNQSAIYLSRNPMHHGRIKHVDVKLHFIRDQIAMGFVDLVKIHTDDNPTDMLTKSLPGAKFNLYMNLVGFSNL